MFIEDESAAAVVEEQRYLRKIVSNILAYKGYALNTLDQKTREWHLLSDTHKKLCTRYEQKLLLMKQCIDVNAEFLRKIVPAELDERIGEFTKPSPVEMDKVRSTLRQFVRDWSEEGAQERLKTYSLFYDALNDYFSDVDHTERAHLQVLVPGAGLGRLAFDIAMQGFSCQGNEYSFYMLLASNFILNKSECTQQHKFYPWIHSFSNHFNIQDQFRAVHIPDVLPDNVPADVNFSMVAGEFLEVYKEQHCTWDAVATCFFIDTAHNIVEYVETMWNLLKPNGLWVNLGPLLYHFEDSMKERSIELTFEELLEVMRSVGFEILETRTVDSTYTANCKAMLTYTYNCVFFKAIKPASAV